jgi:hypothetical protein
VEQLEQAAVLEERSKILTREILEDARKKAARTIGKAEKDAALLDKETARQCEAVRKELEDDAARRAAQEANKIAAGEGLECKRLRLARISAALEELAAEGLARQEALTGAAAAAVLDAALRATLPRVAAGAAALVLAPGVDEAAPLARIRTERPDVTVTVRREPALFPAEFVLEEEEGRIRHAAVFREVYALKKADCLRAAYRGLFGGR